jgi:hypothetical protein
VVNLEIPTNHWIGASASCFSFIVVPFLLGMTLSVSFEKTTAQRGKVRGARAQALPVIGARGATKPLFDEIEHRAGQPRTSNSRCATLQAKLARQRAKSQGQRGNRVRQRRHKSKTVESAGSTSSYIEPSIADLSAPVHQGATLPGDRRRVIGENYVQSSALCLSHQSQRSPSGERVHVYKIGLLFIQNLGELLSGLQVAVTVQLP